MPTLKENIEKWNREYDWSTAGEEWADQADYYHVDYKKWKNSLIRTFVLPYIKRNSRVLELGMGYCRWSKMIAEKATRMDLVDASEKCVKHCKDEFKNRPKIRCWKNDGRTVSFIPDNSIDFIFSYDTFVHIEKEEINSYLKDFYRVLKFGKRAVIHHSNRKNWALKFVFLKKAGVLGRVVYRLVPVGKLKDDGWRSQVSRELFKQMAENAGFKVLRQTDSWGKNGRYNCRLSRDMISVLAK